MNFIFRGIFFLLLVNCLACETDPVIYTYDPPTPVIYGIFNNSDSIHYLKIGKTFGAHIDPLESARIFDSLYLKNIEVSATRVNGRGHPVGMPYTVHIVEGIPKESGIFHFPGQQIYCIESKIRGITRVEVKVPGLPPAIGQSYMVSKPVINTPKQAQQYIYLVPSAPLLVQWAGHPWNEIDVTFEFIEELNDLSQRSKWVHIQNTNYFDSDYQYREMKITYDEFIREVLLQLHPNDSVKQVFLGYISITINGGDNNMVQYIKYLNGYNDFNSREFSNIENGIGLLASRASFTKDSLRFDNISRHTLINEKRLKILKISPWQ